MVGYGSIVGKHRVDNFTIAIATGTTSSGSPSSTRGSGSGLQVTQCVVTHRLRHRRGLAVANNAREKIVDVYINIDGGIVQKSPPTCCGAIEWLLLVIAAAVVGVMSVNTTVVNIQ
jgi:hypothetical protein